MNRQLNWKQQGYTDEQIENHLSFERYKSKQSRERRAKNNEKNNDIIKIIKEDLLGKIFDNKKGRINKILSIRPTTDGKGFWFKVNKIFKDESSGDFREFHSFDGYNKEEFIRDLYL